MRKFIVVTINWLCGNWNCWRGIKWRCWFHPVNWVFKYHWNVHQDYRNIVCRCSIDTSRLWFGIHVGNVINIDIKTNSIEWNLYFWEVANSSWLYKFFFFLFLNMDSLEVGNRRPPFCENRYCIYYNEHTRRK